jgi:hypothetical protein
MQFQYDIFGGPCHLTVYLYTPMFHFNEYYWQIKYGIFRHCTQILLLDIKPVLLQW